MVGVVCVTRFCEAGAKTFSEYIKYIERNEAVRRKYDEKTNLFGGYMNYMDDETKVIVEEQKGLEKVSALFTTGKDNLSQKEKQEIRKAFVSAQQANSNMWQTVISFDNRYLEENGLYEKGTGTLNEAVIKQAARRGINAMLRNEGMENALWTASIHYNTDNIHIHTAIVEPTPMRDQKTYIRYQRDKAGKPLLDENGEKIPVLDDGGEPVTYAAGKGRFRKKSFEMLKSAVRSELEDNREIYTSITAVMRDTFLADKKNRILLDTPEFTGMMLDLYEGLKQTGVNRRDWHYNQNQIASCRRQIDDLSSYFISAYHRDDYVRWIAEIDAEQSRQAAAYGKSNYKHNLLYGKEGLYARLGNAILRELREYDKRIAMQNGKAELSASHQGYFRPVRRNTGDLKRGFRMLEFNLKWNYAKMRNLREAEMLQEEIIARGYQGREY